MSQQLPRGTAAQTEHLRDTLARNLEVFARRSLVRPQLRQASVAVCVVLTDDTPCLLITRRGHSLSSHAGQWALPGGRQDPGETAVDTARRELREETGLDLPPGEALGLLDDFATRSGYLMTPVVLWGGYRGGSYSSDEKEVAGVFEIPLASFDVEPSFATIPESSAPLIQLPLLGQFVHAPTAAVIYQFCQVALHGRHVRVAHYEQPVFAWR